MSKHSLTLCAALFAAAGRSAAAQEALQAWNQGARGLSQLSAKIAKAQADAQAARQKEMAQLRALLESKEQSTDLLPLQYQVMRQGLNSLKQDLKLKYGSEMKITEAIDWKTGAFTLTGTVDRVLKVLREESRRGGQYTEEIWQCYGATVRVAGSVLTPDAAETKVLREGTYERESGVWKPDPTPYGG